MAALSDSKLNALYHYWKSKCGEAVAPLRSAIRPTEIPALLRIINILDVTRDPLGFRHKLVGMEWIDRMGRDVTGQAVDAILYGDAAEEILASLKTIVTEKKPYRRFARLDWKNAQWLTLESTELPLLDAAGEVVSILRGCAFSMTQSANAPRLQFDAITAA